MALVILPTAGLWAVAGEALGRVLTGEGRQRLVSLVLAAMVVATVVTVWV